MTLKRMKKMDEDGIILQSETQENPSNPIGLLNHIEDYTLRELNLLNEITGKERLEKLASEYSDKLQCQNYVFQKHERTSPAKMCP